MESEFKLALPNFRLRGLNHCAFKAALFRINYNYLRSVYIQIHTFVGKSTLFCTALCPITGFPILCLLLGE